MSSFLSVRDLVKEYPQGETPLRVLRGVNLEVREGEFLVIVGSSGAGKSTLLHLMGLLDSPTSGAVFFGERDLTTLSEREQSRLRNSLFGFVFQFFHLLPDFTALENVLVPAMVGVGPFGWARRKKDTTARARDLLAQVGLTERVKHRPGQLSGGERQRVAICRALINKPRVLFLDEPTGNLDSKTGQEIQDLVEGLNRAERQTVVMVTHSDAAVKRASRVVRIHDGQIVKG
jgi:lipoprotein-releasing system ATP-binding protein